MLSEINYKIVVGVILFLGHGSFGRDVVRLGVGRGVDGCWCVIGW